MNSLLLCPLLAVCRVQSVALLRLKARLRLRHPQQRLPPLLRLSTSPPRRTNPLPTSSSSVGSGKYPVPSPRSSALAPLLVSRTSPPCRLGRSSLARTCRHLWPTRSVSRAPFGWLLDHTHTPGMPPGSSEKKAEKSYLASAVDSINPWAGSRTTTPTPKDPQPPVVPPSTNDHATNPFYGQSLGRYPPDCPPLNVKWFHAVDVSPRCSSSCQLQP